MIVLRLRTLPRGARPLLLLIIFLPLFCLYVNPLSLFAKALVLNKDGISEMREPLPLSIGYLRVCGLENAYQ